MLRCLFLPIALLLLTTPLPASALDLTQLFKSPPPLTDEERRETIERIREVQDNLKLLQEKLRALEKRKALEDAAMAAGGSVPQAVAGEANWQAIDQTTADPGEYGLYTYLLFNGSEENRDALGSLEDLILTIETLPAAAEPPALANRFLLPVEPPQSTVALARRPYDFKLARIYLQRLGLHGLTDGPVLVSLAVPLDPFGNGEAPPYLAVALGRQSPQRSLTLAKVWHGQEKPSTASTGHPLSGLFWQVLDGAGATRVTRTGGALLVDLSSHAP